MKQEQIDKLLKIIEENGFTTVKYIAKAVYASESTVRRQLTVMEQMGLVVRSYGGVELKKRQYQYLYRTAAAKKSQAKG